MGELLVEEQSSQATGRPELETLVISPPPLQLYCPPMTRSPLLDSAAPQNPKRPFVTRLMTLVARPMKRAIASMQACLEEVRRLTKLEPQDAWLPITESRNGNAYYAAFHTLNSGIGFQALVLPLAFTTLGWIWGVICLSVAFIWQLHTLWLLIQLHEPESGKRYSRYLRLSDATFGGKLGKLLALFPIMYLAGGTCITQIMIGGGIMKTFFHSVCGETCRVKPLSIVEWYALLTCLAIILSQLPNLNSIAGVSLVGAITSIGYCSLTWIASVINGRPEGASRHPPEATSEVARLFDIFNALGIIAFAFRGHNLVLEIQGTMPSSGKHPPRVPMWRAVKFAYLIVAACLYPLAIGGYWAYGNLMSENGGILTALYTYHKHETSKLVLGIASLLVVINSLSSFPIYAMPVFDNWEFIFTKIWKGPIPWWVRAGIRVLFGFFVFFIATALPFLLSLGALLGGIALPVTFAYPCLMWVIIKKPKKFSPGWCLNWALGTFGMVLCVLVTTGAIWDIVTKGIEIHIFKPQ